MIASSICYKSCSCSWIFEFFFILKLLLLLYRYVVRAKAGKKQSSKDASGGGIHSAGASLRRYNELALKKVFKSKLYCFSC